MVGILIGVLFLLLVVVLVAVLAAGGVRLNKFALNTMETRPSIVCVTPDDNRI